MIRSQVYDAFLAQLQSLAQPPWNLNIPVISDEFVHWADAAVQPAIYMQYEQEDGKYERPKINTLWTLRFPVWMYAKTVGDISGFKTLRAMLDTLEQLIMPQINRRGAAYLGGPPLGVNTLGGLVHYVCIQGTVLWSPGYLTNDQAVVRVPIEIVTAN